MSKLNLIDVLEAIEEICQCPICLNQVTAPVVQCENGHMSCGECRKGLNKCSICQGDFALTPARVVEQMLERLPNKCKYANKGCRETEMNDHEEYCEYRQIRCRVGENCEWHGMVKDWLEHVDNEHKIKKITLGEPKTISCSSFDSTGLCLTAKDEIFLLYFYCENGLLHHSVRHVPINKPKHVYYSHIFYPVHNRTCYFGALIKATPLVENDTMEGDRMTVLNSVLNDATPSIIIVKEKNIGPEY